MHLYIAVRGQKGRVEDFIRDLQAQYFPYKYAVNQEGQKQEGILQMGVRPIEFYEIVVPEDQMSKALGIIAPNNSSWDSSLTKWVKLLRKFMRWEEMPKYQPMVFPTRKDIEILGLGIKKDRYNADGIEQL